MSVPILRRKQKLLSLTASSPTIMGKRIAALAAVTVIHAAAEVSWPVNPEVKGGVTPCFTQMEQRRSMKFARLERPRIITALPKYIHKGTFKGLYILFDSSIWMQILLNLSNIHSHTKVSTYLPTSCTLTEATRINAHGITDSSNNHPSF